MIWDKIIEIGDSRIGVLLFEGENAKEEAQTVLDSKKSLNPEEYTIVSRHESAVLIGSADNRQIA